MENLKRGMKVGSKTVFDMEAIFIRLLMVGQQRQLHMSQIFQYELCAIPPSLIDEYGCLRKGNKYALANRLGVQQSAAQPPDIVIVDTQQLLYHIVWPHGGTVYIVAENIKRRLSYYPVETENIVVFDKYDDQSAKDHERMRRAGEGATEYNVTASNALPKRDAVLNNKHNNKFYRVLSSFNLGDDMSMESRVDAGLAHDEADITMVAYTLQAA